MRSRKCPVCGENLETRGNELHCRFCDSTFDLQDEAPSFEQFLEEKKQEMLAIRRRVLWEEAHKAHPSAHGVVDAAKAVRQIYDDDPLARFYIAIHEKDPANVNAFLNGEHLESAIAEEIVRFSLISMSQTMTLPLKTFVERHFKGELFYKYMSKIEEEADALEEGIYMTSLPRDVFLAYSSKDMEKVSEMTQFLEDNGFTVFCALRNLRHGAGSEEFYRQGLEEAMRHCKAFVFLSSHNSRTTACDALKEEIPYVLENLPNIKRIHYRLDEEGETKIAASILLKEFDDGREWCRSKEDLVARLLKKESKPKVIEEDEDEEEESKYPYISEYDDDGFLVIHEGQKEVQSEFGSLNAYTGYAKKVRLGDDFHSVSKQAFKTAIDLEELDLGNGVSTLPALSFTGAMSLKKILGGDHVTLVGDGAFAGTPKLQEVHAPKSGAYHLTPNGMLVDDANDRILRYIGNKKNLGPNDFPAGVTTIDAGAFAYHDELSSVELPSSIMSIGNGAFAKCLTLYMVKLNKGILTMGKNVFSNCPSLTVYVPSGTYTGGWDPDFAKGVRVAYR